RIPLAPVSCARPMRPGRLALRPPLLRITRYELSRRAVDAPQPARGPGLALPRLGDGRRSAGGDSFPGLCAALLLLPRLSGNAAAGGGLLRVNAPQPVGRAVRRDACRPGAGFGDAEESAGRLWHRQDDGGLLCGFGGHAVRCRASVRTAAV